MRALITLSLTLMTIFAYAQKVKNDPEWVQLSKYDSWANQLSEGRGVWKKPLPKIMSTIKSLKAAIQESSRKHGVDPVAVGAAIMTENSINITIEDDVQDLLASLKMTKKGELLGKKMSFGLGQLYFDAAREAEDHCAKIEKRVPRSDSVISNALHTPEQNIELIAMVMRKIQDDYLKNGYIINDKPEILTTLYNLGGSASRAAKTKASNATPRMNFFGLFTKKYLDQLAFLKVRTPCLAARFRVPDTEVALWSDDQLTKSLNACDRSLKALESESMRTFRRKERDRAFIAILNMQTNRAEAILMKASPSLKQEAIQFAKVCEKLAQGYKVMVNSNECAYLSLQSPGTNTKNAVANASDITKKLLMNVNSIEMFEAQSESAIDDQRGCDQTDTKSFDY